MRESTCNTMFLLNIKIRGAKDVPTAGKSFFIFFYIESQTFLRFPSAILKSTTFFSDYCSRHWLSLTVKLKTENENFFCGRFSRSTLLNVVVVSILKRSRNCKLS